jgi:hypothetical protein
MSTENHQIVHHLQEDEFEQSGGDVYMIGRVVTWGEVKMMGGAGEGWTYLGYLK